MKDFIENIEVFNGIVKPHFLGYSIERFPNDVIRGMSDYGANIASMSCGCEVRFVRETSQSIVNVTLYCEDRKGLAVVMRGDRYEKAEHFNSGETKTITIGHTPNDDIKSDEYLKNDLYSPSVVRIILWGARFVLCSINTFERKIRPPKTEELPKFTCLAYGSSITHGAASVSPELTYIAQAARCTDTQTMNKGLGGSCFIEKSVVDWFCKIPYDYMIFECGTNMYCGFENSVIKKRGEYMLLKMLESHPDKYIFMLEPPMPYSKYTDGDKFKKFIEVIYKIYKSAKTDKCVYFEAEKIEDSTAYLTCDRIHPSAFGHIMMGTNLSKLITPYLK